MYGKLRNANFCYKVSAQVGLAPSKPDKVPLSSISNKEQASVSESSTTLNKSDVTAIKPKSNSPSSPATTVNTSPTSASAAIEPGKELSTGKDAAEQKEASREQAAEGEALVAYLQGQRCLEDMLEELSESASVAQVRAAQLAELMMYPVDRFLRADLDGAVLFYSYMGSYDI